MEPNLDQVRQELAEIYDKLLELPADDLSGRADLKERQNELRQLSAQLVEGKELHDSSFLKSAYRRLTKARDQLLDRHLPYVSTEAGDAGIEGGDIATAINRAMDSGMGLDEIESRMREIIAQLRNSE